MYDSIKRPFSEIDEYSTAEQEGNNNLGFDDELSPFVNGFMDRWVIRMRGLPYRATKKEVELFFSDVDVVPVKVCFAQLRSGRASGEALVEFDSKDSLEKAYGLNKENFLEHGRYIEMFDSSPDAIDIVSGAKASVPIEEICDTNTSVIKMRGMPFTAGSKEVTDFLQLKNIVPVRIHHVKDRIGRPAGMCYVELKSDSDAGTALTLDHAFMGSRYVEVFSSTHNQLAKDVNSGVMTVETQFAGANPNFGDDRGFGGRGFRGGRGRGRGRGRNFRGGGKGFGGRGRGRRGQGRWITTTVPQPMSGGMGGDRYRSRGGFGFGSSRGGGGYGPEHPRGRGGYRDLGPRWNPNQPMGSQGPWQYDEGHPGGSGYRGGFQGGNGY